MKIAIMGTKGGSGKSTIAHMLCMGAAQSGITSSLFTTDDWPLLYSHTEDGCGRGYYSFAFQHERLFNALEAAETYKERLFVIDLPVPRRDSSYDIASQMDLIIIPFRRGYEDTIVAMSDYIEMKKLNSRIVLMPSMFSTKDKFHFQFPPNVRVAARFPMHAMCDVMLNERLKTISNIPYPVRHASQILWNEVKQHWLHFNNSTLKPSARLNFTIEAGTKLPCHIQVSLPQHGLA